LQAFEQNPVGLAWPRARSPVGATADTWRFRDQPPPTRAPGDELTVGFLRHERTKRMTSRKEKGPCPDTAARARRSFFPPSPGYPSLGCTPAEPNSVSPGDLHLTSNPSCPLKTKNYLGETGSQVAQQLTARNVPPGPKPAEPDPRLQRLRAGVGRTIMREMRPFVLIVPTRLVY
jgi:hypothetical protein